MGVTLSTTWASTLNQPVSLWAPSQAMSSLALGKEEHGDLGRALPHGPAGSRDLEELLLDKGSPPSPCLGPLGRPGCEEPYTSDLVTWHFPARYRLLS